MSSSSTVEDAVEHALGQQGREAPQVGLWGHCRLQTWSEK